MKNDDYKRLARAEAMANSQRAELMETLKHGVTLVSAEGMYSRTNSTLLICIIPKREITAFKRILAKYPDTFSYRSQVNEVYGKFRKHKNDEIS